MNFSLPDPPDPVLLQPVTLTAVAPLYLSFYALAVLAILPNTFIIKLSILPFIVWQAWSCAVGLDNSIGLAKSLGIQSTDRLRLLNNSFVVSTIVSNAWKVSPLAFLRHLAIGINVTHSNEGIGMDLHQETAEEV